MENQSVNNSLNADEYLKELVQLFDKNIYLINRNYQILHSNQFNESLDSKQEVSTNQLCYKTIFNLNTPCQYCGFSFSGNIQSDESIGNFKKRTIRIKNHIDQNTFQQDCLLTQAALHYKGNLIFVDIVEVSKNEPMFDASDQLTTLGAHVQTVAHELSNPITGLNLTRQQIVKILDSANTVKSSDLKPLMDLLLKDIRRAAGVLSEIRNYSRPVSKSWRLVDLKSVLKAALDNVTRIYQLEYINIFFDWNVSGNGLIPGNSAKLEQCFINIIKNSFEMFGLRTDPELSEMRISVSDTDNSNLLRIQIIDNAGGISNDALTNVFKPYFTTKERFRGLGLGLYIAGKILKEHHSTINLESVDDKTVVTIYMKQKENIL